MYYEKEADKKHHYLIGLRNYDENAEPLVTLAHYHDSLEFFFVSEGEVEIVVNGYKRVVSCGEIFFANGYDIHSYYGTNCKGYALVFAKEYCRLFLEDGETFNNFITPNKNCFDKIYGKIDEFYRSYGDNKVNKLLIESLAAYILGVLTENVEKVEIVRNKSQEMMVSVMEYINENYKNEILMTSIAAEFGYTPNYFSSIFNKFARMSFNDYLNYVRYTHAAEILNDKNSSLSVTDVAMSCGFGSMNTFYRAKQKFSKS